MNRIHDKSECPSDGHDSRGRCVSTCGECGEHLLTTGRYTTYCPSCETCPDCGCPQADGFSHYQGCAAEELNFDEDAA